jgi:hypothetical protein
MTKLADDPQTEHAKKQLEADKKVLDHSRAEYARLSKGKPTPTQEENDLAALGAHILEHEADGSDEEKALEPAHPSGGGSRPQTYATRQQHAKHE